MNPIKLLFILLFILIKVEASPSPDTNAVLKLEDQIDNKSLEIDTSSILTEDKIKEVKEYIAYMEALLKKNNVEFSKQAIAEKNKIDKEINDKLNDLKDKLEQKEKDIAEQKKKKTYLTWGIVGVLLFLIPTIFSFLLMRNNKKSKQKNLELESKNKEVEKAYSDIKSSINYANRIQTSVLVKQDVLNGYVEDSFILLKSKEKISGDFYFFAEVDNKLVVAIVDCTSEGVAGAFLTMMWLSFLKEIVKKQRITSPAEILKLMDVSVKDALSKNAETAFEDGMYMSIVCLDKGNDKIEFSGANQPLYYIENKLLKVIKGVSKTVGVKQDDKSSVEFLNHTLRLSSITQFYVFTHGYYNQLGGVKTKRYSESRFSDFIFENHLKSNEDQKNNLEKEFEVWRKEFDQTEDILIIGVKIN